METSLDAPRPARLAGAIALALVLGAAAWLISVRLGAESLLGDEAIYASAARDSARSGSWFPLEIEGRRYTGKPPLGIWAMRASFAALGVDELSARLPAAIAGWAAIAIVGLWTARRAGYWTATLAAGLLASGHLLLFRHGLRQAVLDGPLLLATVAAVVAIYVWTERPQRRWLLVAAAATAAGALIKGPIAPALVAAITIPFALLWREPPARRLRSGAAAAIAAGLLAWGLVLLGYALAGVEEIGEAVRRDLVDRATVGIDETHRAGLDFYPRLLARELGAWLLLAPFAFLPAAAGAPRDDRKLRALALAWALGPTLLLSLPVSKLAWYLYPALPGYVLLVALGAERLRAALARRPVAVVVLALALATLLGVRFSVRARRALAERPEQVTLRALADRVARDPTAVVVLDEPPDPAGPPVREWHRFYLGQIPSLRRGLGAALPPGSCPIVVTWRPVEVVASLGLAGDRVAPVYRVTASEAPLAVVDGCGGRVAAELRALKTPPPAPGSSG